MKKPLLLFGILFGYLLIARAQVVTPSFKANFGIDGELRSTYFGTYQVAASTSHDWFTSSTNPNENQRFVIDTTGAAYILARYNSDPAFRRLPFFRTMRYPAFSVLDNRRLIDAVFIRDYHGADSTVFAMSNKNGGSPADWTGAIEGNIPQKNDILDIMVHVRRAGSSNTHTVADSLFFIGGIAIEATSGSRYFDFELYQTDIFYNRSTQKFTGYGPDAGHTSWEFDPVTGAVSKPGDVIFSAEFGGSGLQDLVARIWVHRDALQINSPNFNWDGTFDGASSGATYGYAGIRPKNDKPFYTGMQNTTAVWAGPFKVVRRDDSVKDNYDAKQFLEFSVNMGTLGLDPISLLGGGSQCDMPFRRILVKTRSSASFTAELKDFVGPFDFFNFENTEAYADIPMICGDESISTISVINPLPSSVYTWYTPDGNIVGPTTGLSITVDTPGTYIVRQQLLNGCNVHSEDTVVIEKTPGCGVLSALRTELTGRLMGAVAELRLTVSANEQIERMELEASTDGKNYTQVKQLSVKSLNGFTDYKITDNISQLESSVIYYRVKFIRVDGSVRYTTSLKLFTGGNQLNGAHLSPNPVSSQTTLSLRSSKNQLAQIKIFNELGALLKVKSVQLMAGTNTIVLDGFETWSNGVYPIRVQTEDQASTIKMVIRRSK
ncbi:MAG TPA: T9SS type A sorting domain-containing protein [Flavihumibacter sp.]